MSITGDRHKAIRVPLAVGMQLEYVEPKELLDINSPINQNLEHRSGKQYGAKYKTDNPDTVGKTLIPYVTVKAQGHLPSDNWIVEGATKAVLVSKSTPAKDGSNGYKPEVQTP